MRALESGVSSGDDVSRNAGGFLLDDLALTYLGNAWILEAVTRSEITLFVHPSTKRDQDVLLSANREGKWLADKLDRIRTTLRDLLDRGQVGLLPGVPLADNDSDPGTLTELCKNVNYCDFVCIDDRFANRFRLLTDESGASRPLACVLDLIRRLVIAGRVTESKRVALEHRLRAGGIALVDIDGTELFRLLVKARINSSEDLVESAELRTIRQYLGRLRTVEMLQMPIEALFLERLLRTSVRLIRRFWEDKTIETEHVLAVSRWIVRNIHPNPIDWIPGLRESSRAEQADIAIASYLKLLVSPLINATSERSSLYTDWLDREVIAPLRPRNAEIIKLIVEMCKKQIEELGKIDKGATHEST